ncbi:MAG: hypothetical protein OES46_12305 [Gammaproteobacteria bacterium]|jgi:hypothetical protein|nr:hypothetical protein [Gammaproteobacteria bacterium]
MPIEDRPIINRWYKRLDKGYQFQVVMVDEAEDTVEIQHFDGDLEELDLDTWNELEIEMIEPPEDWTGPMDDIELDDLGYTDTGMTKGDWDEPLQEKGDTEERDEEEEGGLEEQGQEEK